MSEIRLKSLPDLGGLFAQMKIREGLEMVSDQNLFGFAIRNALANKRPMSAIVKMILDQAKDNESSVMDIVGCNLYNAIKSLYGKN